MKKYFKELKKLYQLEGHHEALAPIKIFITRMWRVLFLGLFALLLALCIGIVGYHYAEKKSWLDAFADASMILSGMGPLGPLKYEAGKIFAGCYALFSGLVFILITGLIFTPILHRVLHKFHLKPEK